LKRKEDRHWLEAENLCYKITLFFHFKKKIITPLLIQLLPKTSKPTYNADLYFPVSCFTDGTFLKGIISLLKKYFMR